VVALVIAPLLVEYEGRGKDEKAESKAKTEEVTHVKAADSETK
jgi:hypothetical protein